MSLPCFYVMNGNRNSTKCLGNVRKNIQTDCLPTNFKPEGTASACQIMIFASDKNFLRNQPIGLTQFY